MKGEIPGLAPYGENATGQWVFKVTGPAGSNLSHTLSVPAKCSSKPSCHASFKPGPSGSKVTLSLSYNDAKQLWTMTLTEQNQIPRNEASGNEQIAISVCPSWFDAVSQAGECASGQFQFQYSHSAAGTRLKYP